MRNRIVCAFAVTFVLAGCAVGPRAAPASTMVEPPRTSAEALASCEKAIYRAAEYDRQTGLQCGQLLDIWR